MREAGIPKRQESHARPSTRQDGLRSAIDVADELCAPAPALENDLSTMKGFEFGPMTDANDGRVFELLGQELHQLTFTLRVERRGCFVQHDYIWSVKEDSRKRQALLLPAR